jgi:SAM-dependent methyltransferase
MIRRLKRLLTPRPGAIDFGDLGGTRPVSNDFGWDRGTPVDRIYIDRFLNANRGDVRGRALEIGDASYCRRFGSGVTRQEVLHVDSANREATIIGDLSQSDVLARDSFDCLLITQTLHLIFDLEQAAAQLHGALSPGGVLLLTVPGITPIDRREWRESWYWSLSEFSLRRLFEPLFGLENMRVETHGNVYAATCFLHGLAAEEVDRKKLDPTDDAFPVVVSLRGRKAE